LLQVRRREAGFRKPGSIRVLLAAPFGMTKTTHDRQAPADQRGVRGEDHIGDADRRFDAFDRDVARALQDLYQAVPLARGFDGLRSDISRHPRIDIVGDGVAGGRAHQ